MSFLKNLIQAGSTHRKAWGQRNNLPVANAHLAVPIAELQNEVERLS